jgi:WD40 repeat protein
MIRALTTLPNGDLVSASGGYDLKSCQIIIWNPNNWELKRTLSGMTKCFRSLTKLPNGDLVSGLDDSTIKIWIPNDGTNAFNNTKLNENIFNSILIYINCFHFFMFPRGRRSFKKIYYNYITVK